MTETAPHILVLDSGLGGLSVLSRLREVIPHAPLLYVADTAAFPYGSRSEDDIFARASAVIRAAQRQAQIALVVIACNTLSTLCLTRLRAAFDVAFVGTVPAIKVAASTSKSRRFSLLATPNTVHSSYTDALIAEHAADCIVDRVAAPQLASIAEAFLLGDAVNTAALAQDIAPCFQDDARGKTDCIVLGCTHYPFLIPLIESLAPWPVALIDPALAIAKQTARLWNADSPVPQPARAFITRKSDIATYDPAFERFGFRALSFLNAQAEAPRAAYAQ